MELHVGCGFDGLQVLAEISGHGLHHFLHSVVAHCLNQKQQYSIIFIYFLQMVIPIQTISDLFFHSNVLFNFQSRFKYQLSSIPQTIYYLLSCTQRIIYKYKLNYMQDPYQSDIDFYLMKITRLEADLAATQDQLMAARLRLRTAEDFQIKYELLLKQSQQENYRLRFSEKEDQSRIAEVISLRISERDDYWSDKLQNLEKDIQAKNKAEVQGLKEELVSLKKKNERKSVKFEDEDLMAFKIKKLQREKENLEQKIQQLRVEHEKSKDEEVRMLRDSLTAKSKEKQDTERKIYREKIEQLQLKITKLEEELLQAKTKADPEREREIERLKKDINQRIALSGEQLERIAANFSERNQEMTKLLEERYRIEEQLIAEKKELRDFMKSLQDKIFQKEKEHEIELINLKQRMSKIREEEVEELKKQIKRNQENFQIQRSSWDTVIEDKDAELNRIAKKAEQETNRHKDDKSKQLKKISELKERLKEYEGDQQAGETENLIKSLKDLESREADFANYENGVTFLDRQLKKSIMKIEQKNIQVTKLVKELNEVRADYENELDEIKEKAKKDKKYYSEKISQLETQIRDLNELMRAKEKDHKKKQKDLEAEINRQKVESKSFRELVDEMQRDYNRLAEAKKGIQTSYREERERGLTSKSDLTLAKKQKWLQLQRQKNELEVIFKEKEEQLKTSFEVQKEKLRHERDKLKKENQIQKAELEELRKELGEGKDGKQNIYGEYHKKMATLNLEIALTKNIYQSLIQAKARTKRTAFEEADQAYSNSENFQNEGSQRGRSEENIEIKVSSPVRAEDVITASDFQRLGMSFKPKLL